MGRILTKIDFKQMPWKNGRGSTTEIYRWDRDGHLIFRVSSAMVSDNGPFSDFSGYDRTLVNLGPGAMTLQHDVGNRIELQPFGVTHFDGGVKTEGAVTQPCRDLNVFCANGVLSASTFVRQLPKPEFVPIPPTTGLLIYVIEGSLVAKDLTGREYFVLDGEAIVREPSDSVNQQRWMLASASENFCRYVAISFREVNTMSDDL